MQQRSPPNGNNENQDINQLLTRSQVRTSGTTEYLMLVARKCVRTVIRRRELVYSVWHGCLAWNAFGFEFSWLWPLLGQQLPLVRQRFVS